jgi:RimJ/RimL family protein N-acetyltransferase
MIHLPLPALEGLATERLTFRKLRDDDRAWWSGFLDQPEAVRFLFMQAGDPENVVTWFERTFHRYQEYGTGLMVVEDRATGMALGQCGLLVQEVDGALELEVGYHFMPVHWGKGYATEAARACMDRAAQRRLSSSGISLIHPENARSRAVALRNGLTFERRSIWRGHDVEVYRRATEGGAH